MIRCATLVEMNLYGQEPEARLLGAFLSRLEERSVIDVGAEHGSFVEEMLSSGAEAVHAIEPEPGNANFIRERFGDVARVSVHEYAVSDLDGELELYRSVDPSGAPLSFGHTLLERTDTDEVAWREPIRVAGRSLASLVGAGELPARAGILKVDTEGSDFAVIAGMGDLECDVVMVEHWVDLPHLLGPCPWSTDAMASALRERGFSHYVCIEHRGEFVFLKWDDGSMPIGHMGNLVFLHDRVLERLFPDLLECASQLANGAVELGEMYEAAAAERLVLIGELERECELRLRAIEELRRASAGAAADELAGQRRVGAAFRRVGVRLRRIGARIRSWTKPKIGHLRHYEPKQLSVPAYYLRTEAPSPAPTISLVTPSFQQGRFLERTLYSVFAQRYPALEYVVQDGGSSDDTLDVLARIDPLLTRWASEPDEGQADAINRGFRETSGEIMAWLNSDDLLLPGSLAYVARYFAKHPDVDVVYGHRVMIDEHDCQIGAWILPAHHDVALTLADYIPQETLFWRRRIWEAAGGHVDMSLGYALDWDLLLRFRDADASMVRLPRFLGAFRIHDEQKTTAAADAAGVVECDRLRQRVHGRSVPIEEVLMGLRPFFVRHIVVHSRQRIVDRLPVRRVAVPTSQSRLGSHRSR